MYSNSEFFGVEDKCYDDDHIKTIVAEIDKNFGAYFNSYLQTDGGKVISKQGFEKLQKKFGASSLHKTTRDLKLTYSSLIRDAVADYEKDLPAYQDILDIEALEEHEYAPQGFKNKVLRDKCPIIHSTYYNVAAKALDKYRKDFNIADANKLLKVTKNLVLFAENYTNNSYDAIEYENNAVLDDFGLYCLDSIDENNSNPYSYNGVIGGGIRSHFLYKINPAVFPNRGRMAIWALWYLTDKKKFGCHTDSEFLMIDVNKIITQQNYFYPYELFTFYAFHIYKLLKAKADDLGVVIKPEERYIVVDSFLNFVANEHQEELNLFSHQIANGGLGYD